MKFIKIETLDVKEVKMYLKMLYVVKKWKIKNYVLRMQSTEFKTLEDTELSEFCCSSFLTILNKNKRVCPRDFLKSCIYKEVYAHV